MDALGFKGVMFIVLAVAAVVSSLMMVTRKNPIHSALWLIVAFFTMAVIYLILNAQFIAVAQVMVYAGAIMMLIIFVIMLIHMETGGESAAGTARRPKATRIAAAFITVILFVEIAVRGALLPDDGQERRLSRRRGQQRRQRENGRGAALRKVPVPLRDRVDPASGGHRGRGGPRQEKGKEKRHVPGNTYQPLLPASAAILFTIGAIGVITRRNAIMVFMCIELMLNAVNLVFIAAGERPLLDGRFGLRLFHHDRCRRGGRGRTGHIRHGLPAEEYG